MNTTRVFLLLIFIGNSVVLGEKNQNWPQFRGINGAGIAAREATAPVQFGPEKNVHWQVDLPAGISSPCVWGDRLFITAYDKADKKLQLLCLDRKNGATLWSKSVTPETIEKVHPINSPASATPATDGERVYCYFSSYGLLCYDVDGTAQWEKRFSVPKHQFGSGTSPAVCGDLVILNRGTTSTQELDDYLYAFNRRTGDVVWKRSFPADTKKLKLDYPGYATPMLWDKQLVVHRGGGVDAYELETGTPLWRIHLHTYGESTPVVGDNRLYVSAWANFGEPDLRFPVPKYKELLESYDKNTDRKIHKDELPDDFGIKLRPEVGDMPGGKVELKAYFGMMDNNQDQHVDANEWQGVLGMVKSMYQEHGLVAIKPGGKGDITTTHILWKENEKIPEAPSPLYHQDRIYIVKNGGIASCFNAETGALIYQERLGKTGPYYASPILVGDRIYAISWKGAVTVYRTGDSFKILAHNDLKEKVVATPAVVGNMLIVRTAKKLYAFGE